jgi:hypothetical protein
MRREGKDPSARRVDGVVIHSPDAMETDSTWDMK